MKMLKELKDPRSILALIESLLDDDLFDDARVTIKDLIDIAEKPLLFVAKNNEIDPAFREKCLRILIETGSKNCFEALESMITAKEIDLQILAIQLLGDLDHEKSAGLLLAQLDRSLGGESALRTRLRTKKQQETDPDPRFLSSDLQKSEALQNQFLAEALLALGKRKEKKAIPDMLRGLEQRDSKIYSFSVSALGYVEAKEAVEPLCAIIKDRAGRYKEQAIQTLARIGDVHSVPFLRQVVQDVQTEREYRPDTPSSLASYAIQALAQLGDLQVIQMILTAWEDELEGAVLALGDTAIPQLIDALSNSQSPKVRLLSAEALGFLGAKDAMGSLISGLQDKDEDVRNMAAWALNEVYTSV
jgi:HEAT repeat protein